MHDAYRNEGNKSHDNISTAYIQKLHRLLLYMALTHPGAVTENKYLISSYFQKVKVFKVVQ